ncbi:MAG: hypothetical protein OEV46_04690 [Betaproteobacteria bacterium]|nr:hypothetical protein [Betaproteobacteria bacterium]MDH5287271.1 hypothetical protein [Betaproteobacteria bacterium]
MSFLPNAFFLTLFALATAVPAAAQDDLPGRVGRLADLAGRVYISAGERAEDWLDARRNDTVTGGDNLWVAGDGRAEIDYGGGQFRLAGDTNVHIARLDDAIVALFVAHGRAILRVRVLEPGEAARVDTPNTQIALTRPGLYRIDVSPDRTRTELVVREGEAMASFATGVQQVLPGQTALLEGAEPAQASVRNGFFVDGFDTWSAERDRRYERSRSATYVSPQMIGYADLDEYGRWESAPEYGMLWYPAGVVADWAPYRYGRWSWVAGWGWTWVDDAPWGYAPFHYGRWVHHHGRWGWAPGGHVARPVWSPAMVAWFGGSGWSASVTFGAPVYGWVPLAWGEPFIPWWGRCSQRCWTLYNRPYAVNLAERPNSPPTRYRHWSSPGGATAVPGATFTGRRPVNSQLVDPRPHLGTMAPVLVQAPPVERPVRGTPGARPPGAPPPAAAFQTRPMRLPTAVPSAERAPAMGGQASAVQGPQPAVRPPARAPAAPGTWGPTTGQSAPQAGRPALQGRSQPPAADASMSPGASAPPPATGTIRREARPQQGAASGRSEPKPPPGAGQARPDSRAPAPSMGSSPPRPPSPAPQGSAPLPQAAPPVPRGVPPAAQPGGSVGGPVAPRAVPGGQPPQQVQPAPPQAPRAPAPVAKDGGMSGEAPPGRAAPKEQAR